MFFKKYFYFICLFIFSVLLLVFFWSNINSGNNIPFDIVLEKDPTFLSTMGAQNILFSDVPLQFLPYRELYSYEGIFSFWNPYSLGGLPFFEDIQARQLDITNIIGLILNLSTNQYLLFSQLFLMLFGGFSVLLFLRALKISRVASLFASIIFMFSSPILIWINYPLGVSMVYLPFIFLCIENIYNKKIWFYPIFSIAIALQFFCWSASNCNTQYIAMCFLYYI